MPKKIKPAKGVKPSKKRPSAKLVEGARDFVLDAFDAATSILTKKEGLALIATLRDDLDMYQSQIQQAGTPSRQKPGELWVRHKGDRTIITLAGVHKGPS